MPEKVKLPVCIKLRNAETYYLLLDKEELVVVNLDGNTSSLMYGTTDRLTDNETFAEAMLCFHEKVSIDTFNKKKNEVFDRYNEFMTSTASTGSVTVTEQQQNPELPF